MTEKRQREKNVIEKEKEWESRQNTEGERMKYN